MPQQEVLHLKDRVYPPYIVLLHVKDRVNPPYIVLPHVKEGIRPYEEETGIGLYKED